MRKLDFYIGRSFLEPFLVATAAIVGLYMVADAFGKLDDFLREARSFHDALARMGQVYILRIPTFLAPVLPISMVVGAAYGVAQLNGHNELTAMQACGVSFWRILAPIYVIATVVALLGFANREIVVPRAEQLAAPDMLTWIGKDDRFERVLGYLEEEGTHYTFRYNVATKKAQNVFILKELKDDNHLHIRAQRAEPVSNGWLLMGVQADDDEVKEMTWETSLRPADLELLVLPPDIRPLKTLRTLIRREPENLTYRLFYHARLAYPFTGIVLVGLGLPFVIGNERIRRSRMLGVGVCVIVCMVFYAVQFIAHDLGQTGQLPPAVAAWLPVVVFGALGLYLLETVHS